MVERRLPFPRETIVWARLELRGQLERRVVVVQVQLVVVWAVLLSVGQGRLEVRLAVDLAADLFRMGQTEMRVHRLFRQKEVAVMAVMQPQAVLELRWVVQGIQVVPGRVLRLRLIPKVRAAY
jgi:hypothetical protein